MNVDAPLTTAEFQELEAFLRSETLPKGTLDVSTLDGFLTALVVSPVLVLPSEWLPQVWGGQKEPEFDSEEQASRIFGLILRRFNEISHALSEHPDRYSPLLAEAENEGQARLRGENWCVGFLMGVGLRRDEWKPLFEEEEASSLLLPMMAIAKKEFHEQLGHAPVRGVDYQKLTDLLAPAVVAIDAYWKASIRSMVTDSDLQPAPRRAAPRVGRNDPCPCGSGKKYKKCCGLATTAN